MFFRQQVPTHSITDYSNLSLTSTVPLDSYDLGKRPPRRRNAHGYAARVSSVAALTARGSLRWPLTSPWRSLRSRLAPPARLSGGASFGRAALRRPFRGLPSVGLAGHGRSVRAPYSSLVALLPVRPPRASRGSAIAVSAHQQAALPYSRLPPAHGSLLSPFAGARRSLQSRLAVAGRAKRCRTLARSAREDAAHSSGGAPAGRRVGNKDRRRRPTSGGDTTCPTTHDLKPRQPTTSHRTITLKQHVQNGGADP